MDDVKQQAEDQRGGEDPELRPNYQLKHTLTGHGGPVASCKFADIVNSRVASASSDKQVRIWDAEEGTLLRTLEGHTGGISDVAWQKGSAYLCSASDDKTLKLWDVETGQCVKTLTGHSNFVFCCNFDPVAGHLLVSGSFDETVRVWDVRSGKVLRELPAHSDPVTAVDFNNDGTLIASCSFDGLSRIWDAIHGQCLKTLVDKDNPPVSFLKFSPNGKYILASSMDSKIRLWNYEKGRCVKMYEGHQNTLYCCVAAFATTSGMYIVSGSEDSSIYLWELNKKKVVQKLQGRPNAQAVGDGHCDAVLCVDAHSQHDMLASAGHKTDCTVKIWADNGPDDG